MFAQKSSSVGYSKPKCKIINEEEEEENDFFLMRMDSALSEVDLQNLTCRIVKESEKKKTKRFFLSSSEYSNNNSTIKDINEILTQLS